MRCLVFTLLAVLAACASPGSLEKGGKGGLVSVKVDESALSQAYAPRRLALLVGVSQFQDAQWRDLRYSAKDAEDLAAALRDPTRGHFDQVRVLTRPEETTRASILDALRQLRRQATRPDDVVVVYFSAHGTLARDGRGELKRYLVTTDASFRAIAQTALSMDSLKSEFDQLPSRRRLMVLATCHSGSGKSLLPQELEAELAGIKSGFYARPLEESSRASMVFAACDWGETAREDEGLKNDIYTHFLIDGLNGAADRNFDGAVTATEAHDHARRHTYAFTEGRQRPSAEILEVGADPVVLSGHIDRTGRPELFSYNPRLDGFTLKVDGETRTELPGGAAVTPGRRTVELTKGNDILMRQVVDIAAGERLPLERLLSEAFPRRSLAVMGGMFSFVDARSRNELLPASPELAVVLRLEERPLPDLSLVFDMSGSRGRRHLHLVPGTSVPFTYTSLSLGAAVPYTWRWGRLSLYAGPRVAALFLQRSFQTEAFTGGQQYFTFSPGVMGGVAWRLGERLELTAQAQLMVTYVVVDGQGQALGFSGGWAGVGYRF
ncbi:caspase family protein [Archangium sp.]|uniref:caspase family protein n=1 Tax=Archangium sp. TaxID=1872627 RepID=UPI002D667E14|nr:caspase family protein [Archangium sp.]HYO54413.1 caspase family protein [Archangium sp.]